MHRSFLVVAVVIVAFIAGVAYYALRVPVQEVAPVPMEAYVPEVVQYPAFTMQDLDGKDRDFSEWDGRHRLLNFWATWCAPCRREIPLLKEFQAEQGDDGILVMGIAVDFAKDVARYAEAAEFNYPILVGQDEAMAVAESSGVTFIAMPFTMIISRDGEFLGAYLGELHRPHLDKISNILSQLDNGEIDTTLVKREFDRL